MYGILAIIYEFLSEFVPFLIVLACFKRRRGSTPGQNTKGQYVLHIFFALYIMIVFFITNAGTLYDALTTKPQNMLKHMNLIPFSQSIDVVGYGLNVILFLPFGFLVPLIWKKLGKLWPIMLGGLGFSLLIEVSQLFSSRGTDIDDLMMNTLGAVVGYGLYKLWCRITKNKFQQTECCSAELPIYILAIFLGRFFLFNRVGLIHWVYGD